MDLVSRLKKFIDHTGLPVTQFADACSIPRPTMSQLLSGRNKKVSNELITKLHDSFPDLNVLWLMFGQGTMLVDENIATSERQNKQFDVSEPMQGQEIEAVAGSVLNFGADHKIPSEKFGTPSGSAKEAPTIDSLFMPDRNSGEAQFQYAQSPAIASRPIKKPSAPGPASAATGDVRQDTPAPVTKSGEIPTTIPVDTGKRVINIIVYYSDNSFQSFVPEQL